MTSPKREAEWIRIFTEQPNGGPTLRAHTAQEIETMRSERKACGWTRAEDHVDKLDRPHRAQLVGHLTESDPRVIPKSGPPETDREASQRLERTSLHDNPACEIVDHSPWQVEPEPEPPLMVANARDAFRGRPTVGETLSVRVQTTEIVPSNHGSNPIHTRTPLTSNEAMAVALAACACLAIAILGPLYWILSW